MHLWIKLWPRTTKDQPSTGPMLSCKLITVFLILLYSLLCTSVSYYYHKIIVGDSSQVWTRQLTDITETYFWVEETEVLQIWSHSPPHSCNTLTKLMDHLPRESQNGSMDNVSLPYSFPLSALHCSTVFWQMLSNNFLWLLKCNCVLCLRFYNYPTCSFASKQLMYRTGIIEHSCFETAIWIVSRNPPLHPIIRKSVGYCQPVTTVKAGREPRRNLQENRSVVTIQSPLISWANVTHQSLASE